MEARENVRQIVHNDILHMKISEFYLCFHNSCEIWHLFSRAHMMDSVLIYSFLLRSRHENATPNLC